MTIAIIIASAAVIIFFAIRSANRIAAKYDDMDDSSGDGYQS